MNSAKSDAKLRRTALRTSRLLDFLSPTVQMNDSAKPVKLLLTPRQTAEALAISERKLWSLTASGEVPCVRLGRSVRYRPETLARWLAVREG